MNINKEMYDVKLNGIKRTIQTGITGQSKVDPDSGKKVLDKDGNPIPEFPPQEVKYTLDYEGVTLQQLLQFADSSITIKIANSTRPKGAEAVKELNGSTVKVQDVLVNRKVKLSPYAKASGAVDKMNKEEKQKLLDRLMSELK